MSPRLRARVAACVRLCPRQRTRATRPSPRSYLATLLVIGFALHNATEGFGIVAALTNLTATVAGRRSPSGEGSTVATNPPSSRKPNATLARDFERLHAPVHEGSLTQTRSPDSASAQTAKRAMTHAPQGTLGYDVTVTM